jgi:hypothetical protein
MRAWLVMLEAILDLLNLGMVYQGTGELYGSPSGLDWDKMICWDELRI